MYKINWSKEAEEFYVHLKQKAEKSYHNRLKKGIRKSSKNEGLLKQIKKTIEFLEQNPRHPSLKTHPYTSLEHPYYPKEKVFEAYVQNKTPSAYRVFWCYGPEKGEITIISITSHP